MSIWKIDPEGRLTALAQGGGEAGVWVPSEQIVFHRAELPPGRQQMWEQTVAFALEEQVAAPVEDQHFAIGRPGEAEEKVPVAVVSLQQMQAWADAWEEQGVKPGMVWPDVLAVPYEERRPALWHENGRGLLRLDAQTGLAGSPEWLHSVLEACGQSGEMRVFSDAPESLPPPWRTCAEALPCSLDERMSAGEEAAGMNLLQGTFRTVSAFVRWGRPWAWAAAAAAAAVVFYVALLTAEVRLMDQTTAALKQATAELYQKHFPEQALTGNLRAQVGRRMDQVKGGVVKREASPWQTLVRVEPLISTCKACRVEEVKLERDAVSLVVSSSAELDGLLKKLERFKEIKVVSRPLPEEKSRKRLQLSLTLEKRA